MQAREAAWESAQRLADETNRALLCAAQAHKALVAKLHAATAAGLPVEVLRQELARADRLGEQATERAKDAFLKELSARAAWEAAAASEILFEAPEAPDVPTTGPFLAGRLSVAAEEQVRAAGPEPDEAPPPWERTAPLGDRRLSEMVKESVLTPVGPLPRGTSASSRDAAVEAVALEFGGAHRARYDGQVAGSASGGVVGDELADTAARNAAHAAVRPAARATTAAASASPAESTRGSESLARPAHIPSAAVVAAQRAAKKALKAAKRDAVARSEAAKRQAAVDKDAQAALAASQRTAEATAVAAAANNQERKLAQRRRRASRKAAAATAAREAAAALKTEKQRAKRAKRAARTGGGRGGGSSSGGGHDHGWCCRGGTEHGPSAH